MNAAAEQCYYKQSQGQTPSLKQIQTGGTWEEVGCAVLSDDFPAEEIW